MVIGETDDGAQVVHFANELHPDIVLMDLAMPGMDGMKPRVPSGAACPPPRYSREPSMKTTTTFSRCLTLAPPVTS